MQERFTPTTLSDELVCIQKGKVVVELDNISKANKAKVALNGTYY
jgi:hypothetical protein